MKVFAMLHGQTDLDAEGRIQGKSDLPLNEAGVKQVHEAAKNLLSKGIDMMMSSPQKRAMETAEIVAGYLEIEASKIVKGMRLFERDFGDYEGKLLTDIDVFALNCWESNARIPNGETIREAATRVINFMNNMVRVFKGKTLLLVVSGNVLKVLHWYFNGLPESGKEHDIEASNCIVYEFDVDKILPEMCNFQAIADKAESDKDDGKGSRVLTQQEIDDLISEIDRTSVAL